MKPRPSARPIIRHPASSPRGAAAAVVVALAATLMTNIAVAAQGPSPSAESTWPPIACAGAAPTLMEPAQTLAPDEAGSPAVTGGVPMQPGPVAGGLMAPSAFLPRVTFELGEGWALDLETREYVGLTDTTGPGRFLGIATVIGIIDPAGDGRTYAPVDLATDSERDCLIEALTAHPLVTIVRGPEPQAFGTLEGWSMDLAIAAPTDGALAGAPLLPLFGLSVEPGPADRLGVGPGSTVRVAALRTPDGPAPYLVVIAEAADPAGFASFAPIAQGVIDSFVIAGE